MNGREVLAAGAQEIVGDRLGAASGSSPPSPRRCLGQRRAAAEPGHEPLAARLGLEHLRRAPQQVDVGPRLHGRRAVRRVDHLADPILVGRRVAAAVPSAAARPCTGCRPAGSCRAPFQRVEAGDAHDRVGLAAEDDLASPPASPRRSAPGSPALGLGRGARVRSHAPQSWQSRPNSLYSAGQAVGVAQAVGQAAAAGGRYGMAATWSRQKAEASATIVQPR